MLQAYISPNALRQVCLTYDPKTILFDHMVIPTLPLSLNEQNRLSPILDRHIRGKKLLVCTGAKDSLVPLQVSQPLLNVLKDAVAETGWYSKSSMVIEERIYYGLGHEISDEMVQDVVDWVMKTVAQEPKKNMEKTVKL